LGASEGPFGGSRAAAAIADGCCELRSSVAGRLLAFGMYFRYDYTSS